MRRKYSGLTLKEALRLVSVEEFTPWQINAAPCPPSPTLQENLQRLKSFDLQTTEQAKTLLMDALFAEIVPRYTNLKVWKAAVLETNELTGIADYLITPKRAYAATPLLCVAEAKRDDFLQGRAQCLSEMYACHWNNLQDNLRHSVLGIVSNGQVWQFYRWSFGGAVLESGLYTTDDLPELLGALESVCAECSQYASAQSERS